MGYGSWWRLPGLGTSSCQVTLAPGTWGHTARTQELPAAAGSGDALGISCKDVQSCCCSHGAAVSLPIKSLHVRMGGHCGVPHVPSCTSRPHSPKDRLELPWLLAQTQHGGIATCPVLCHSELKQLLRHRKTVIPSKGRNAPGPLQGPEMTQSPLWCSSPAHGRAQQVPRCFLCASPAAAGEQEEEEKGGCSCPGLPWDPAAGLDTGITRLQPDHSQAQSCCSSSSVLSPSAASLTALPDSHHSQCHCPRDFHPFPHTSLSHS